ncbi:MAG: hypothetical protein AAF957_23890 [Planctomycetota bacterium]
MFRPALLLASALVASPARVPEAELRFVPSEGDTLAVRLEEETSAETVSEAWCPVFEGERVESEAGEGEGGAAWSYDLAFVLVDEFESVEDGRVQRLSRTFEEIGGSTSASFETDEGVEELDGALASPLDGRTVVFDWDDGAEEYDATFDEEGDDSDIDAVLLGGMSIDAFCDWFLPEDGEPVEEGDEWSPGPDAWWDFTDIGGAFWIENEEADSPSEEKAEENESRDDQLRENSSGDVTCTFEGMREVDGVEVAVISIVVEIESTSETESSAEFDGVEVSAEEDTTMTIESEGECLWDVESGRLVSLRFTTETTIDSTSVESAESDEGTYGMEYSSVVRMESNVEVTVESR